MGDGWFTRDRLQLLVLLVATAVVARICFQIVEPFMPALLWALALAVVAYPMHDGLAERMRRPDIAAGSSVIQGALGGLMYWVLGLPAPLLWGVATAMFALVPMLGAFVIWAPAALWLFMEGSTWKGVVMLVWGALVVSSMADPPNSPLRPGHVRTAFLEQQGVL